LVNSLLLVKRKY